MENTGDDSNLGKDIGDQAEDPPHILLVGQALQLKKGPMWSKDFQKKHEKHFEIRDL